MSAQHLYYDMSRFLSTCSDVPLLKIPVNGGTTCPNRDGQSGYGGCTYCNNASFVPAYCHDGPAKSISQELTDGIAFCSRKNPLTRYLAYFQSYTATYGDPDRLMALFDEALYYKGVEGLVIGTRPDCMPDILLSYFSRIARSKFVLIEYGIESTYNRTLERIARGHDYACAVDAIRRTHEAGISCGAHLILGLPEESREEMIAEADRLSELPLATLKLHHLQILKGTRMAREYALHPERYELFTPSGYIDLLIAFLMRLSPTIALDRFVSQTPMEHLIAPRWGLKVDRFNALLQQEMQRREVCQGMLYQGENTQRE